MPRSANALLIRANSDKSILSSRFAIFEELQLVDLHSYGNEAAETAELRARFGWHKPRETGKFYDAGGSYNWYFYMYGDAASTGPYNAIASRISGRPVSGDVVIVKSGPVGQHYDINITVEEMVDTVVYYKKHDPQTVFHEREWTRVMGELPPSHPPKIKRKKKKKQYEVDTKQTHRPCNSVDGSGCHPSMEVKPSQQLPAHTQQGPQRLASSPQLMPPSTSAAQWPPLALLVLLVAGMLCILLVAIRMLHSARSRRNKHLRSITGLGAAASLGRRIRQAMEQAARACYDGMNRTFVYTLIWVRRAAGWCCLRAASLAGALAARVGMLRRALSNEPPDAVEAAADNGQQEVAALAPAPETATAPVRKRAKRSKGSRANSRMQQDGSSGNVMQQAAGADDGPSEEKDECVICLVARKQVAVVHGSSAHYCLCCECAGALTLDTGCPVCRQHIDNLVQMFGVS